MARYWVGGSGNINDTAHWSASSGGAGGASVPDGTLRSPVSGGNFANDDVFFDANSFSADNQVVTLNAALMPKSLDMSGVNRPFSFASTGAVIVQGLTFTLSPYFTASANAWSCIPLSNAALSVNQNGANMDAITSFTLTGGGQTTGGNTYNLTNNINMPNATFQIASSFWTSATATFNSNNYDMNVKVFSEGGTAPDFLTICSAVANMGTTTLTTTGFLAGGSTFIGYSVTYNGGSTTLNFTPKGSASGIGAPNAINIYHSGLSGTVTFGNININAGTGSTTFITNGGPSWTINGNLTVQAGATIKPSTDGSLNIAGNFVANGTPGNLITIRKNGFTSGNAIINVGGSSSVSYVDVQNSTATGTGAPIYALVGGVNGGSNVNWFFTVGDISVSDGITVTDNLADGFSIVLNPPASGGSIMSQMIHMTSGSTYQISFTISGANSGGIVVAIGDGGSFQVSTSGDQSFSQQFTWGSATGDYLLSFTTFTFPYFIGQIDDVSVRKFIQAGTNDNRPVSEFLSGTTDYGKEIFFRADTQPLQLNSQFETFGNPLAVVTRSQRGTLVKCFVALDDGDFYQIQGTANKGVSILKVHSSARGKIPSPPIARKMRISWRDGSKQLCRLIQTAVIFIPNTMDYSE